MILVVGLVMIGIMVSLSLWAKQQGNNAHAALVKINTLETHNSSLSTELAKRKNTTGESNIDKTVFQAVFLKSGQVYFGKITNLSDTQLTLEHIYYLKTGNADSAKSVTTSSPAAAGPNSDVSLVKLGNEIHGPQDVMYIERKEVTFWENLKSDSQVSKAIKQYEIQNPTSR